jgi:hypothetical protein
MFFAKVITLAVLLQVGVVAKSWFDDNQFETSSINDKILDTVNRIHLQSTKLNRDFQATDKKTYFAKDLTAVLMVNTALKVTTYKAGPAPSPDASCYNYKIDSTQYISQNACMDVGNGQYMKYSCSADAAMYRRTYYTNNQCTLLASAPNVFEQTLDQCDSYQNSEGGYQAEKITCVSLPTVESETSDQEIVIAFYPSKALAKANAIKNAVILLYETSLQKDIPIDKCQKVAGKDLPNNAKGKSYVYRCVNNNVELHLHKKTNCLGKVTWAKKSIMGKVSENMGFYVNYYCGTADLDLWDTVFVGNEEHQYPPPA